MDINEFYEYFKARYPKSILAQTNWEHPDDKALAIDDHIKLEILGLCACGCPEDVMIAIGKYLNAVSLEHQHLKAVGLKEAFGVDSVYNNSLLLYMAYDLDSRGLTEHGSSIGGAWITPLGMRCLTFIKEYYSEEDGFLGEFNYYDWMTKDGECANEEV